MTVSFHKVQLHYSYYTRSHIHNIPYSKYRRNILLVSQKKKKKKKKKNIQNLFRIIKHSSLTHIITSSFQMKLY